MSCTRVFLAALTVLTLMSLRSGFAQEPVLDRARTLVDARQPEAALELLAPLEAERAGDVPFDYVLALATLDSGDAATATMIFERILLQAPEFHGARIDLGRAYFAMGRLQDAKQELTTARRAGPPEEAAVIIDRMLLEIERRQRRSRFSHYLSAATRAGYDSNVNSATDVNEFLGFNLNPRSREQDSDFFEVAFAGGGAYAVRPKLTLSGRLSARIRRNPGASFADSEVIVASARADHRSQGQHRTLEVQVLSQFVDGDTNLSGLSLSGDWRFELGDGLWLGPMVRLRALRYQDELEVKDINQWVLGALGSWTIGSTGQGRIESTAGFGRDRPQRDNSLYARDFTLFTIGLNWKFSDTLTGALTALVEDSDYDEIFFEQLFASPREDTSVQARGVLDWRFSRRWRLSHTLSYRENDTDIDVFAFDRFEATLGLRYVWY